MDDPLVASSDIGVSLGHRCDIHLWSRSNKKGNIIIRELSSFFSLFVIDT